MSRVVNAFFGVAVLLAANALRPAASWKIEPYDEHFYGEGTVYGEAPVGSGNWAIQEPLPSIYDGMIPVALNE